MAGSLFPSSLRCMTLAIQTLNHMQDDKRLYLVRGRVREYEATRNRTADCGLWIVDCGVARFDTQAFLLISM